MDFSNYKTRKKSKVGAIVDKEFDNVIGQN